MGPLVEDYEFLPLRDVVFKTLRKEILMGELKPGTKLREVSLAQQLGVSRTPVREAIRMLELEGLVKMVPRKGAHVANITEKDLTDALDVRNALEKLAIELACERITEKHIEDMKDNCKEFEIAIPSHDAQKLAAIDEQFHDIIFSATYNTRLIQMLASLRQVLYRYRLECLKDENTHEQMLREHLTIIDNLEKHNVEEATGNIAAHITNQAHIVSKRIV